MEEAPTTPEKVPWGHAVQVAGETWPVAPEYVPAMQSVQEKPATLNQLPVPQATLTLQPRPVTL